MCLRLIHVRFDPCDFGLEAFDALLKLLDRHRVEVLAAKLDKRIAGLAGEEIFQVHARNR